MHRATERPISSLLGLQWVECTCNSLPTREHSKNIPKTELEPSERNFWGFLFIHKYNTLFYI